MPVGERVSNHFYLTVHFHSKQDMILLACVWNSAYIWDPACNRDPAYISTNYIDLRPVSRTHSPVAGPQIFKKPCIVY